jgi:hypothetical protein
MTDRAKFEQMLESLINGDKKQAEEIFHELVVGKSREIYENLLDDDIQVDEASDEEEDDEAVDEEVEEGFDLGVQEIGGDPTDDMVGDMGMDDEEGGDEFGGDEMDMGDEQGGGEPATKDDVLDIKDALDELKAEFEAMLAGEGEEDMGDEEGEEDMGDEEGADEFGADDEEEPTEDLVREYVEKVAPAKMGDNGANTKSIVAGKNDMGGTTANIAKGGTEAGVEANKGQLKGNGLLKGTTTDLKTGNVNTPGSKNATKLSSVANGHGAEKKGAGEQAANTRSIVGK